MALSDWKSMYAVSVTAGSGAGANYQHNLYLNYGAGGNTGAYLYFNGQCKTDFTDVRVLSGDGLFLPHTLKNVTAGVSATLVFKDTADCDVAHTVYVLFNNPSATDVSDDAAVFIDSISGVVGAWLMNEPLAADAVVDYSGNGNDGTPTGTTIVDGKYVGTKARSFNGLGNDFITIAHNVALNTDYDFSIVIDFKLAQALFGYQMLIVKGNVNGMYSAYVWTNDYLLFRVNSGTKYFSTFTTFGTDWAQLTITRDGDVNGAIAYKNNVAMTERDDILLAGNLVTNAENMFIGKRSLNDVYFKGVISSILIFNVTLTEEERTNIYANFGDPSLEAGKVLVRKWATTALPTLAASPLATPPTQPSIGKVDLTLGQKRLAKRARQRALILIIKEYLEFKQEQRQKN